MKSGTILVNNITMRPTLLFRLSTRLLFSFGIGLASSAQPAQTKSLVEGDTAFALNLYARLSGTPGNLFFSPYSISTCLAMTSAGARGDTETQMGQVLHFSKDQRQVHSSFGELQRQLNDAQKQKGIQLDIANALWAQKGEPFLPVFLNIAKNDYQANVNQADFKTSAETVRREINRWVAQKTKDKIQDILSPGSVDNSTRLVLANAIYFKGAWASPFEKAATATQPFHISTSSQTDTPLMLRFVDVKYTGNNEFQAVELRYSGDELSLVILLPRQTDGVGQLERQLSPAFLAQALVQMKKQKVEIFLPRFKMGSRYLLNDALAKMGMPDAFEPKADFSGLNGTRGFYISDVIHKAWVEVTEEGSEAAAATVVAMVGSAAPAASPPPPVFRADHPFVFLIRDTRSDSLLFIGRLADPRV